MTADAVLGPITGAAETRLARIEKERIVPRILEGDRTVWTLDPGADILLGWLAAPGAMRNELQRLQVFAGRARDAGLTTAVLLGMGGSSLAPEVMHATFGSAPGALDLIVLDTTDPAQIRAVESRLDLDRTLFIVSSKSGTTIETRSQLEYFWEKRPDGAHFVAVTDPGSTLAALAEEQGFRDLFLNDPGIGGRYSALSFFGLVPAALFGADLPALLDSAEAMANACGSERAEANPGAWLGAVMGEAALAGHDKLTLHMHPGLRTFGWWAEQLVAESTGKHGAGILPIEGEPLGTPEVYGSDRLFAGIGDAEGLTTMAAAGHPVVRYPGSTAADLGAEFFRWEFATAIAGHVLGINPFDQPSVQEAKDATNRILAGEKADTTTESIDRLLASVHPGDYLAILAYVPRDAEHEKRLAAVRVVLRDRFRVATTVGFGPRYLHSTGQYHKGGPATGAFIQVVAEHVDDLSIPGRPYTFGELQDAQALGDLASLKRRGRRVTRLTLPELEHIAL